MARLIYSAISSLDGYIEDMEGKFDWAAPDEEVTDLSTTSNGQPARISMDAVCMKP